MIICHQIYSSVAPGINKFLGGCVMPVINNPQFATTRTVFHKNRKTLALQEGVVARSLLVELAKTASGAKDTINNISQAGTKALDNVDKVVKTIEGIGRTLGVVNDAEATTLGGKIATLNQATSTLGELMGGKDDDEDQGTLVGRVKFLQKLASTQIAVRFNEHMVIYWKELNAVEDKILAEDFLKDNEDVNTRNQEFENFRERNLANNGKLLTQLKKDVIAGNNKVIKLIERRSSG